MPELVVDSEQDLATAGETTARPAGIPPLFAHTLTVMRSNHSCNHVTYCLRKDLARVPSIQAHP